MKCEASYFKCKACKQYLKRSCKSGVRIVKYNRLKRIQGIQINNKVFTNQQRGGNIEK